MTSIDMVKNRLIDRILVTKNRDLLEAVDKLLTFTQHDEILTLSSQQIELLMMSEQDIIDGNLISETDLKKLDIQ
jgi:hypothetical protein